jgi:hypothetical protein
MQPLPPEHLPAVAHFFFTLFGIPFTVAWTNLGAWILVIVAFVAGVGLRLPKFLEGKD